MLKRFLTLLLLMTFTLSAAELQRGSFAVVFDKNLKPEDAKAASLKKQLPGDVKTFLMPDRFIYNLKTLSQTYTPIKDAALVSFEIMADQDEEIVLGVGVDYWFTLFLNGEQIATSEPEGGGDFYENGFYVLQYKVALKKGKNYFVMHTRPGIASWNIAVCNLSDLVTYGPYVFEVDRNSAVVALEYQIPLAVWLRYWEDGKEAEKKLCKGLTYGSIALKKWHRFELKDLKPDTVYRYEILPAGKLEQPDVPSGSFKTLPAAGTRHVMTAISDTQFGPEERVSIIRKFVKNGVFNDTDLLVSLGDVTSTFNDFNAIYFKTFLDVFRQEGVMAPFYPVRGNHEFRGRDTDRYAEWFGRPYYAFRYGDVLYIVLDGGEDKPFREKATYTWRTDTKSYVQEQKAWLEDLVKSDLFQTAKVRIVLAHAPPFLWFGGWFLHKFEQIAGCFIGKEPEHQIDLWLCGHVHSPFRYDPVADDCSGPAPRNKKHKSEGLPIWDTDRIKFPVYINDGPGGRGVQCSVVRLEVEGEKIHLKCYGNDGTLMDDIVIERGKPFDVKNTTFIKYEKHESKKDKTKGK